MEFKDYKPFEELKLRSDIFDQFELFYDTLIEENAKYNLTAITDKDEAIEKHFYDSIVLLKEFDLSNSNVMDIGSGGGFPAIPLAICCPSANFYLVESSAKKCKFLNLVKEKLNLKNVTVICGRVEENPANLRSFFDFCTSRAVTQLRILLELSIPYLKVNGELLAHKGINYQTEIDDSKLAFENLNSKVVKEFEYNLENCKQTRYILDIKKLKETDKKYPRKYSQIVSNK